MGFLDYEKAKRIYSEEPMKENINLLQEFDLFHCLLAGGLNTALKLQQKYDGIPRQLLEWLKVCDGGLLFDTVFLSTKDYDGELELAFDTYDELNAKEALENFNLPEGYVVFAVRSYGDPICFHRAAEDEKVYLWNVEKAAFDDIWESFADWLTEEVDEAIRLIAEDVLEPLGIKLGGDDHE